MATRAELRAREETLGLYVSVPFCRSKCTFCNFASGVYPVTEHGRYVDRLCEELRGARRQAEGCGLRLPEAVDTIYLGGGTPSVLAPEKLRQLFAAIRGEFRLTEGAEITMECAPGQISDAVLEVMAECGVNRVSLGVQSFVDREAAVSGRLHNRAATLRDVQRLRAAGIVRLNLDLIAGLAHQTMASWQDSLEVLLATGVEHASVYMLEVDEDSRLGKEMLAGGDRYHAGAVPQEDTVAAMFGEAVERFGAAGLRQYELSNFSQPGCKSRHNLKYWRREAYLGVGVDAHSMLFRKKAGEGEGEVARFGYGEELAAFLEGGLRWEPELLSRRAEIEEAWFLGLRLADGVSVGAMEAEFSPGMVAGYLDELRRCEGDGLVKMEGDWVRMTSAGKLLSNEVFRRLLEVEDEEICLMS